jgi:hypothetical protein
MAADTKELLDAHEAMGAVLDAKWSEMKEWRAFRAIDRALLAALTKVETPIIPRSRQRITAEQAPIPYMTLADQALQETGQPMTTADLMEYIIARRPTGPDPKKTRIVVQSSLSKDDRFESVVWHGGRAWWWAGRPLPKKETAGG